MVRAGQLEGPPESDAGLWDALFAAPTLVRKAGSDLQLRARGVRSQTAGHAVPSDARQWRPARPESTDWPDGAGSSDRRYRDRVRQCLRWNGHTHEQRRVRPHPRPDQRSWCALWSTVRTGVDAGGSDRQDRRPHGRWRLLRTDSGKHDLQPDQLPARIADAEDLLRQPQ